MKLIGLAGTNGSGKDTVGHFLADKYNYVFISGTDILREECRKRNLPITRENLSSISAEWRREGGPGSFVNKVLEVFETVKDRYAGLVTGSLRHPGEADRVHELSGTVIWVDADPKIRYERIRNAKRGRGDEDDKTFEEFTAEEQREMNGEGAANGLNMAGVKSSSDVQLMNETNLEDLEQAVVAALKL